MQRALELRPRMEPTLIQNVEGVEIWRCFDWYGPQVTCFPGFTLSMPLCTGLRAKIRYDTHERVVPGGVLVTAPNHVLRVEEQSVPRDWSGQPMVLGISAPPTMLTEQEQRRLAVTRLDPALENPGWSQSLVRLCASLADADVLPCEKEVHVRRFVERALAETSVVRNEEARACQRSVERARDYVHANVARVFSLEDVARETELTKWHLARIFRRAIGVSMGEYARHLRAHNALRMLRIGTQAAVVAAELGYSDQPHLTREIQSLFGFTPGRYAKGYLKRQAKSRTKAECQTVTGGKRTPCLRSRLPVSTAS